MTWHLEFAADAEADFELIFDHLFESYVDFGEPPREVFEHARNRIERIRADADRILKAPHRGQRHDDLLEGSRNLVIDRTSYWFMANDTAQVVTVLAVFFGGQEERYRMLLRLIRGT